MKGITKAQYLDLISNGSVPMPVNASDLISLLKSFDSMSGSVVNGVSESEIDKLVLKLAKTNGYGYLSSLRKDAKRRKVIASALDENPNAVEHSISRLCRDLKLERSADCLKYKVI